jgi:hypothetical protein
MASSVAITGGAGTAQVITGARTLRGITVRESAGSPAAASVVVRDATAGTAATDIVASVNLPADGSKSIVFPKGIKIALGVRVTITGAVEGSVWVS